MDRCLQYADSTTVIVVLAWKMVSKRISLALAGSSAIPSAPTGGDTRACGDPALSSGRGLSGKRPAGGTIDLCFGLRMGGFTGPGLLTG